MALSRNTDEGRASGDSSNDSPAREPGEAALTQQDVHDRADAVETAATRPLTNNSVDPNAPLATHDNLGDAGSSATGNVPPASPDAESARRKSRGEREP